MKRHNILLNGRRVYLVNSNRTVLSSFIFACPKLRGVSSLQVRGKSGRGAVHEMRKLETSGAVQDLINLLAGITGSGHALTFGGLGLNTA